VYPQTKTLFSPLPHFPNKTFPSDHTTLAFVIFFVSLFLGLPWSWHLLPLALWVGWGRVYCGVHYPGDVFGGILVSMGIAMFLKLWVVHEFFILLSFI
jgi:undecaprenyl-diphosphatase